MRFAQSIFAAEIMAQSLKPELSRKSLGGERDHTANIFDRIQQKYAGLSKKLKLAARFVADNILEVATRSLRSVASACGVSPATFSRFARELGYSNYENMREDARETVEHMCSSVAQRLPLFEIKPYITENVSRMDLDVQCSLEARKI